MKRKIKTRDLVVTAMLSAIAFALMLLDFSLPVMPSFIKLDVSDLPALIGGFALGPAAGVAISFFKNLLNIAFEGTTTAGVGEVANFILASCFVTPAALIYKKTKGPKNGESAKKSGIRAALIGCVTGAVSMAVLSLPVNYFITYPAYIKFYGMTLEMIVSMYQAILPWADSLIKCLLVFNVPFTLFKGCLTSALAFLVYKRISPIIKGK